jgi:hypothetical protein
MRPEKKRDYRQQRLAFANQALWERLPELHRLRCRDLIVELLRTVVLVRREPRRGHERED